ncbi:NUDIX hydrolase [Pseudoroseicyclus sp. CXY001]|uniref:NUDIX hydrolase n=1 Tax=Pseudoroseicyclus sp. CXY001 TaxID=3242492 RepID=UPI0035713504
MLGRFWKDYLAPILGRPPRFQVAALCWRRGTTGIEVLLVTSLETRRWILPKGWPHSGLDAAGGALAEAWEEAGVKPQGGRPELIGAYRYNKRLTGNLPVATVVHVHAIEVSKLHEEYPEAGRRERRWMSPADAAAAVDEPELARLLLQLPTLLGPGT